MPQLYWGDPDDAFARWDADQAEYESKCPVCDYCDEAITDETYTVIEWGFRAAIFHNSCASDLVHIQYTSDYIREREEM